MANIKATELRIGNIVEHEDPCEIVEGIHYFNEGDDYRVLIGNYLRPIDQLKPIKLTEEWLVKFGFKYSIPSTGFSKHYIQFLSIYITTNGYEAFIGCRFVNIKHVHQLQNLYFALTGGVVMPSIKFNRNYNNKLNCNSFTTIRLHSDQFCKGLNYTIMLGKKNYGVATLKEKRTLRLDQLNEFISHVDAGIGLDEFAELIKTFYDSKNIDWRTQELDLLLLVKCKDKGEQGNIFN